MGNWKKLISFQVSALVLFSVVPEPINIVGADVFFIAFRFYKAALLVAAFGIVRLILTAPHFLGVINSLIEVGYYGRTNLDMLMYQYIASPLTYCYEGWIQQTFTYELWFYLCVIGFIFSIIGIIYLQVSFFRKYVVHRVQKFLV